MVLAYAGRLHPARAVQVAGQFASMGYALPGSVIAVGVLLPLAWVDHGAGALLERVLGRPVGLFLTGSAIGLVGAYVVRFLAVSLQTVDASLTRISPLLDDAARSLGAGAGGVLRRVHVPMIRGGLATALILVFVETMKEMPATLLLRPFGLNTLSVEVWERTPRRCGTRRPSPRSPSWAPASPGDPRHALERAGRARALRAPRISGRRPDPRARRMMACASSWMRRRCSGPLKLSP